MFIIPRYDGSLQGLHAVTAITGNSGIRQIYALCSSSLFQCLSFPLKDKRIGTCFLGASVWQKATCLSRGKAPHLPVCALHLSACDAQASSDGLRPPFSTVENIGNSVVFFSKTYIPACFTATVPASLIRKR
jgi:hypothetical protein